jgi:flavin-dependent dehydrogenase
VKHEQCFLIGDSAGLASVDLGEGIGPAVQSALMAAGEILGEADYRKEAISPFSFGGLTQKVLKRFIGPRPAKPAPQV